MPCSGPIQPLQLEISFIAKSLMLTKQHLWLHTYEASGHSESAVEVCRNVKVSAHLRDWRRIKRFGCAETIWFLDTHLRPLKDLAIRRFPPLVHRCTSDRWSPRELDILRLIVKGLNNQEIAETLNITRGTVKWHVNIILRRLDVNDRTQAVVVAAQRGIVDI